MYKQGSAPSLHRVLGLNDDHYFTGSVENDLEEFLAFGIHKVLHVERRRALLSGGLVRIATSLPRVRWARCSLGAGEASHGKTRSCERRPSSRYRQSGYLTPCSPAGIRALRSWTRPPTRHRAHGPLGPPPAGSPLFTALVPRSSSIALARSAQPRQKNPCLYAEGVIERKREARLTARSWRYRGSTGPRIKPHSPARKGVPAHCQRRALAHEMPHFQAQGPRQRRAFAHPSNHEMGPRRGLASRCFRSRLFRSLDSKLPVGAVVADDYSHCL